ncbi:hypothetical protein IWW51_000717 [Coemansia sp. RSA 2702]|nr:hypothetical protein IWW52_003291 [Coemansia sp. RSA 2704]KAJ2329245.1 hypothetical protein IWW51_000717 [Coemansia sp. RSA 2702]KAJ2731049.1 hypothetical protein H4R23_003168 [Coemansia sp. Cherry 401B]
MVTDPYVDTSFDQHSGRVASELSGLASDSHEDTQLLSVNETMSDIGRVVSQNEAGMDFTTNMDAPVDGVWRHKERPPPVDDISMSRLAESYWKPQRTSDAHQSDDLQSMEFSTHSADAVQATGVQATMTESAGQQSTQQLGSFHSDSGYQHREPARPLPRRPESYHPQLHDQPMFPSPDASRLPTLDSQAGDTQNRFARLAARYFSPNQSASPRFGANDARDISSDGLSDLPAMPDTPDIHTAFTSDRLSMGSPSPSPPPQGQQAQAANASIVARTQTALQMRFAGSDEAHTRDEYTRDEYAQSHGGDTYSQYAGSYTRRHPQPDAGFALPPRHTQALARTQSQPATAMDESARPRFERHGRSELTGSYLGFSLEDESLESLEHPNMGSQHTRSPGGSLASLADSDHARHDGIGAQYAGSDYAGLEPSRDHSFEAHGERFEPITNASDAFGSGSSNPDLSSIMRDHEHVFSDLFHSDDEDNAYSNEFDPARPPASLFASSASIVAEMSRRKGVTGKRQVSSWDGHEATPERMREQERRFGAHAQNPIEMLGKANSLGIDDDASQVSGLLPASERSSYDGIGLQPRALPPPPTTPTTIIARDTLRRPSSRVLRQVPHLDAASYDAAGYDAASRGAGGTFFRRPAGPRALERSTAPRRPPMLDISPQRLSSPEPPEQQGQRNARAAADFAHASMAEPAHDGHQSESSSHGLGSLFQDSLPTLDMSRASKTPNALSRLVSVTRAAARTQPPRADHSASSLMTSQATYVPFQDPTVDVSQLARYGTVGMRGEPWALRSQHKGVSADRIGSPRNLPLVAAREIHSAASASASDAVPTERYGSPTPPGGMSPSDQISRAISPRPALARGSTQTTRVHASNSGPTLTDIYELLKRTASIIDKPHDGFVPLQSQPADQSMPVERPSAPTPRRSRQMPHVFSAHHEEFGSSQQRARDVSESMVNHDASRMTAEQHESSEPHESGQPRESSEQHEASEPRESSEICAAIDAMGQAVRRQGTDIPLPLAEKLLELAAMLARAPRPAAQPADGGGSELAAELQRLQRDILNKFDEYRAEVDMLRAEVRQGGSSAGGSHMPSVVPHDSVSAVEAARQQQQAMDPEPRLLTPSPRPPSDVRPLYTVPTTVKNRQRHMVQWLHEQEEGDVGSRRQRSRASRLDSPTPLSRRATASSTRFRTTIDDVDSVNDVDDVDDAYALHARAKPSDDASDDGALSDASTTVPGTPRLRMRSPIDPAMVSPANVPSRRQLSQRPRPRAQDLLATRETLESIRRRSPHPKSTNANDDDDAFARVIYDARMARELAHTLAELQRVHVRQFHTDARASAACPVCASLEAQNHDPYLFGKHAKAYKSLSTRELQAMLNAYVSAMESDYARHPDPFVVARQSAKPAYHAFTPTRKHAKPAAAPRVSREDRDAHVVIDFLSEELDALSRRYHRMVAEYHALDPADSGDQQRRRRMARELKDLVDLLDVKGEQISVLADLHPKPGSPRNPAPTGSPRTPKKDGCIERAYRSAKALQQALGDLY